MSSEKRVEIESEEFFVARGWVKLTRSYATLHDAKKWANRKKRARDVREIKIIHYHDGQIDKYTVKTRWPRTLSPTKLAAVDEWFRDLTTSLSLSKN